MVVLERMNMSFKHVILQEDSEMVRLSGGNLINALVRKEIDINFGGIGKNNFLETHFDLTNTYNMLSVRWYVPCSVKYPRWSSVFRILSVELWIVVIISILIATISTTLVGRYSCTSEWQGYKTLTSSLTKVWAVILGVSVSKMPRTTSLRLLFLAWVCFSLAFSTVLQAFLTTFLIDSGYKTPIQNMDELFASDIKLSFPEQNNIFFQDGDQTEISKIKSNLAKCKIGWECLYWALYHKNVSIFYQDF